jgi:hypothetical protein
MCITPEHPVGIAVVEIGQILLLADIDLFLGDREVLACAMVGSTRQLAAAAIRADARYFGDFTFLSKAAAIFRCSACNSGRVVLFLYPNNI